MYAQDNDGIMSSAHNWADAILPYIKNAVVFSCPNAPESIRHTEVTYSFNPVYADVNLRRISEPAKALLLYDSSRGQLAKRHGGGFNAGFADGMSNG